MSLTVNIWAVLGKVLLRPANIPAGIAIIVMAAGAIFAEQQNNRVYRQNLHADVLNQISLLRARLEGNINTNLQLVRGLVSTISTEKTLDQQHFTDHASHLFASRNQLRNVAAAPDLVVSMVYPLVGNEAAIGLDYRLNTEQRDAALRVRDTGQLMVAGPVDLVQGGQGIIGRFPVYVEPTPGQKRFWGIVSAVVDAERLYAESGLNADLPIEIAITGKDATGADGPLFYGAQSVLDGNPVTADVVLPNGSWQLAAIPEGGWMATPDNVWTIRSFAALAAALVVLPILAAGWLFGERHEHIRELKNSERELQRLSERLELALRTSQIGVWENDVTRDLLFWDRRMRELYGAPMEGEVDYTDWSRHLHPEDVERARREFHDAISGKKQYSSEFRIVLPHGEERTIRAIGSVTEDAKGNVRMVGVNWDISEDVRLNEQLRHERTLSEARNAELEVAKARIEHNALHDALTGLPNRRYLDDLLSDLGNVPLCEGGRCGLLHIDLDRFKQINDTLGHAAGDAMLVHVAEILRENVRTTDFVARIGGDEFVVVCMSDADDEYLETIAARIVEKMRQPVVYEGRECRFGVSIGIAAGDSAPGNPQQLFVNADIALYRAKNSGRNAYCFFTEDLHLTAINTKRVADEILAAIEEKQFVAHYQGQFDANTLAITGVEALARWKHPEKGLLLPSEFIEIAEDLSVMATIDSMILDQALAQMKRWRRAGLNVPRVAVNVSARRLHDECLVDGLERLNIEPGTLSFELVESIFLDDSDELVAWNIDRIKELGIDIEIDDFGTGYASIVSLMQLRPRRLKIDRQLVLPTTGSAAQRELVRSIVRIGASLGIASIAEGVETMEHAAILRDLGCQTLQGYALARPMSGRSFTRFAREKAETQAGRQRRAS